METFLASLAIWAGNSPVPSEFHAQRPVTRNFDVFFDLRLNKRLSKQSRGWWFETLSPPLWRHRNESGRFLCGMEILKCLSDGSVNGLSSVLSQARYNDVIMCAMASQITSLTIVHSTIYSGADQRKHITSVTGLCEGNLPVTAQRASNAQNVSIWWRHPEYLNQCCFLLIET